MLKTLKDALLGAVATASVAAVGFLIVDYVEDHECKQVQEIIMDDQWNPALSSAQKQIIAKYVVKEQISCLNR